MPQLKTNTVTVTNGSNAVTGSGTTWLTGPNPVTVGAYLIISDENGGSPTVYEVQSIPTDTSITLTTTWAGVTGTYNAVIHIDFLPNGVPALTSGDLETVAVINRAHKILGDSIATGTAAATTEARGTVEKATSAEAVAGTADKFPDAAGVKTHLDNRLLGTVSEVGGVPAGAIFQKIPDTGNGEAVLLADGRVIINAAKALQYTAGVDYTFDLPVNFIVTANVGIGVVVEPNAAFDPDFTMWLLNTSQVNFRSGNTVGSQNTIRYILIGRWY